jgi:HEAT repeat protein
MLSLEQLQLTGALERGDRPASVQVTLYSDLSREDVAELRPRWPLIPGDLREDLLERAAALAEDNVDLDFTGLVHVALNDESAEIRRRAIEAAWESRDRETARLLANLLANDDDESVRAAAATGLEPFVLAAELGEANPEVGDAVVNALRAAWGRPGESIDVRARAVESLGARSLPWVETLISDAYYSDDERLRMAAIRAMGQSAQERWLEYLEETAVSDDPAVRYETAVSLGVIGSEDGIDMLADMLADEDPEVVNAAVTALGQVGGEDAIDHLTNLLEQVEEPLREAIEAAIDAAKYADSEQPDLIRSRIGL